MGSLSFSLFGFPVQIQPSFWLLALLAATSAGVWQHSVAMVLVVALSILVHELGHATLARRFGQQPVIALHMMGGVTSWIPTHDIGRGRSMLITAAGPFAGFALGVVALAVALLAASESREGLEPARVLLWTVDRLCMVNFFWSAINLLPVLPFDGGQLLALALGKSRRALTATLSLIFGLICGAALWFIGYKLAAIVFWVGGVTSYVSLRRQIAERLRAPASGWAPVLTRIRAELDAGRLPQARALARAAHAGCTVPEERHRALELLAWGALMASDREELQSLRSSAVPAEGGTPDALLWASIDEALDDVPAALERVATARQAGDRRPELAALEIRLLLKAERAGDAARLTQEILGEIDAEEARRVAELAFSTSSALPAAALYRALFDTEHRASDAYQAARAYMRAGMPEPAMQALADAVAAGYSDTDAARSDDDLAALAGNPRFEALLAAGAPRVEGRAG